MSIITESLYDNPLVVFREYVQNSMDSLLKEEDQSKCEIKIPEWYRKRQVSLESRKGVEVNFLTSAV